MKRGILRLVLPAMIMVDILCGANALQVSAHPLEIFLELDQDEKPKQIIERYGSDLNNETIYDYNVSEEETYVVVGRNDKKISTYFYNQDNQRLACTECDITYENGQAIVGEPKVTELYIYNENGWRTQSIDMYGVTSYYNEDDGEGGIREKSITGNNWYPFIDTLEDKNFEQLMKDGIVYTYCYHENGELYRKQVMQVKEDNWILTYAKDDYAKMLSAVYSSGESHDKHEYVYNEQGKLEDEYVSYDSGLQIRNHYEYDAKGNLLMVYMIVNEEVGITEVYMNTYDENGRLIRVECVSRGELSWMREYIYD